MSRQAPPSGNVPEYTVSSLSASLKKTLEDSYGYVRVRGELSRVTVHSSGHLYSEIKDESAVLSVVCWRNTLARLSVRPEQGLDVICTGRISTYPARSGYQFVIDSMELAGEGALLKMLEARKRALAKEGLFDQSRKKPIPFLPARIGVITSPTGAVIRDILHRISDRFPTPVLLWPVPVQGADAAEKIAKAIAGFDALPPSMRPDVLIVARGGGSTEDLMAFNEEIVVRAVAACRIPVISAIGHETDTTLIDYAADLRAPTPTGAAEQAVPTRLHLLAQVQDDGHRLLQAMDRRLSERRDKIETLRTRLGDPGRVIEMKTQHLDHTTHRLESAFEKGLGTRQTRLIGCSGRLTPPRERLKSYHARLKRESGRITFLRETIFTRHTERLEGTSRMLESLSFARVLDRGFVLVRDSRSGAPLTRAAQTHTGQSILLEFQKGETIHAQVKDSA